MRRVRELREVDQPDVGAGTAADKRAHGVYALRHADPAQIEAAYRSSWLMCKVVDLPPQDETRAWRRWQAGPAGIAAIEAEQRRLYLRHKLRRARVLARLFGGGAILLGVGADDPSTPLDPARVGKGALRYAHVLSRWELGHAAKRLDPEDPWFGQPEHFTLRAAGAGRAEVRLHPLRVIAFVGQPIPEASLVGGASWFWGDPLMQSIEDAVKNADVAQNGLAALIEGAKVDVFVRIDREGLGRVERYDQHQRDRHRRAPPQVAILLCSRFGSKMNCRQPWAAAPSVAVAGEGFSRRRWLTILVGTHTRPAVPPTRFNAADRSPLTQINPKERRLRPNSAMRYEDETDESYFARRAAEHRLRVDATGNERARDAHRRMAAAYERQAIRALLDRSLG